MASSTKTNLVIGLLMRGGRHNSSKDTSKYECWTLNGSMYWVGKNGALRAGRTSNGERSLTGSAAYTELLVEGVQHRHCYENGLCLCGQREVEI